MNLTKIASEGENLKSKSGQIHGIEHQSSNGKVIKFAGVPVLSVRVFKKSEGTQPRRRLGSKVTFFSTRRDTVNFAFVYHGVSMYFIRCIITFWNTKLHLIASMYFITGLNIPLHCIKVSC